MDTSIKDKIFSYIDAIAAKLGVASEYVYGLMVKQQITQGLVNLSISIIGLIVIFIGIKVMLKSWKWAKKDMDGNRNDWSDYPHVILPSVFGGIAMLVGFFIIVFGVLPDSIMQISNPQYYAIKEILGSLK